MKKYIKVKSPPNNQLPGTIPEQRNLSNQYWKELIFSYILLYYKDVNNETIQMLIEDEKAKPQANIETAIKKHIKKWFRKNEKFLNEGFIVDIEVGTEGKKLGSYDIKVQHSYWRNHYFPFECKNLGVSKSQSFNKLINEYVFTQTKDKTDGGMYRYIDHKYAANQNFGGMIAFVISETKESVIDKLIEKIEEIYPTTATIGKLIPNGIIKESIFGNENTFNSLHIRKNLATNQNEEFTIYHIIMDFFNCSTSA